jgi:hypothetical protein
MNTPTIILEQNQKPSLRELKCSFFSMYQFSNVCFEGISNSVWNTGVDLVFGYYVENGDAGRIYMKDTTPLLLKSISNITDYEREYCHSLVKGFHHNFQQNQIDYLRSRGYAVPFMEFSVQELVSLGWIKLISE